MAPRVRFMGPGQLLVDTVLEDATCEAAIATDMRVTLSGLQPAQLKGVGLKTHEDYVRRFGETRSSYDLNAVEAGRVVIDGIRRAADELGRAEGLIERREAVRKAIASTRGFDGLNGRWSFDRDDDVHYDTAELDTTISGFRVIKSDGLFGCSSVFDAQLGRRRGEAK